MVIIGGFILMTHIGDQEFIIIIIHIRSIIIMDIELQEIMVIEAESIIEMTHRVLDLIKVEEMKHHLFDHKEPKLRQLGLNENIDLKHLRLDHKVVVEEYHQEEEVNNKSHHNRWVFYFSVYLLL